MFKVMLACPEHKRSCRPYCTVARLLESWQCLHVNDFRVARHNKALPALP
jgi:hypothetical protein